MGEGKSQKYLHPKRLLYAEERLAVKAVKAKNNLL